MQYTFFTIKKTEVVTMLNYFSKYLENENSKTPNYFIFWLVFLKQLQHHII